MRRSSALAAVLAAAACSEATPPDRPEAYDYIHELEDGFPIIFRWTTASLPVRVWVQPIHEMPRLTAGAIRLWEDNALYGEFTGVLVGDSSRADVIILYGTGEELMRSEDASERRDCSGFTRISVELDTTITLPFRTVIRPRLGATVEEAQDCAATLVAHELGHALGIFRHSDDPDDLMYQRPGRLGLSDRDRTVFATLYHTTPTVRLPPDR